MKNILKNSGLRHLSAFFVLIFVGNMFSMGMTPQEREKAKIAAQKMMKDLQQQQQTKLQQERAKQYQPGKYFVFEKGTSKGILINQELMERNSQMVKSMVQDFGSRPQEIVLPFPIDDIRLVMNFFENYYIQSSVFPDDFKDLSLQQLDNVLAIERFLLVPDIIICDSISKNIAIKDAPLEYLIKLFNDHKCPFIGKYIMGWVSKILTAMQEFTDATFFLTKGRNGWRERTGGDIKKLFASYKGQMIEMIPGLPYLIPDYKKLADMNVNYEHSLKNQGVLTLNMAYNLTSNTVRMLVYELLESAIVPKDLFIFPQENNDESFEQYFKHVRIVDFLDVLLKRMRDEYAERASFFGSPAYKLRSLSKWLSQ